MSFVEAQNLLIEQLKNSGINAASHASQLHDYPAVLIAPANFSYNRLARHSYTAKFDAFIIARDSGVFDQPLDDLYKVANKIAHDYGATDFEAVNITLSNNGGGDGLPALKTEITLDVKETEE